MDSKQFEAMLSDAETRLRRLKTLYDQWFSGIERTEPSVARKELEDLLARLRREQVNNTALRFRLQQIVQRHTSFSTYWRRISRQIEEGTFKRDLVRARKSKQRRQGAEQEEDDADFELSYEIDVDLDIDQAYAEAAEPEPAVVPERSPGAAPPMAARSAAELDAKPATVASAAPALAAASAAKAPLPPPAGEPPSPAVAATATSKAALKAPALGSKVPAAGSKAPAVGSKVPPSLGSKLPPPPPLAALKAPPIPRLPQPAAAGALAAGASGVPVASAAERPAAATEQVRIVTTTELSIITGAGRPSLPQTSAASRRPAVSAAPKPHPIQAGDQVPANTNAAALSSEDVERIYAKYVAARKQNAERTDNVKLGTVEKTLRGMLPQLEKKHAGKKIDFEVVVKDGKVALKPVAK